MAIRKPLVWLGSSIGQLPSTDLLDANSPTPINLTLINGWTGTCQYLKTSEDIVLLIGLISKASKPSTSEIIGTLPSNYRPAFTVRQYTSDEAGQVLGIEVNSSGQVIWRSLGKSPGSSTNLGINLIYLGS